MCLPVFIGQLDELHWIGCNIDCEVEKMGDSVTNSLNKYDRTNDLVEVDVVIQGKNLRES